MQYNEVLNKNNETLTNQDDTEMPTKKPFKCSLCDYSNVIKSKLKRHIDQVHVRIKPYTCPVCNYKCTLKEGLKKHNDQVHEKIRSFKCENCNYSSYASANLKYLNI